MRLRCFVTCIGGLEEVLAAELAAPQIQAQQILPGASGVYFQGDWRTVYRANLWLRSGIRVLVELGQQRVLSTDDLYAWALKLPWTELLRLEQTFSVEARVRDSEITHSKYAAMRIKDALCDRFRQKTGHRPSVDVQGRDLPLFLSLYKNVAVLYRDTSGQSLHKRGYRDALHKSSLNETVAAGILALANWQPQQALCDPMCGAGTLLIEAALKALNKAPGLLRREHYPFERWPDLNASVWRECMQEAREAALDNADLVLMGNDRHAGALSLARKDARSAGVERCIRFAHEPLSAYLPPQLPDLVVSNPPWGDRLDDPDLVSSWKDLRLFLKRHCAGKKAWLFSGNAEVTRHLGLRAERKIPLTLGKVECRLLKYNMLPPRTPASEPGE